MKLFFQVYVANLIEVTNAKPESAVCGLPFLVQITCGKEKPAPVMPVRVDICVQLYKFSIRSRIPFTWNSASLVSGLTNLNLETKRNKKRGILTINDPGPGFISCLAWWIRRFFNLQIACPHYEEF